jgi:hypothetical protein
MLVESGETLGPVSNNPQAPRTFTSARGPPIVGRPPPLLQGSSYDGVLAACEKATIEDGLANRLSVGTRRSARLGIFLRVSRDEDVSDAAR